jgi:hypothetical protein
MVSPALGAALAQCSCGWPWLVGMCGGGRERHGKTFWSAEDSWREETSRGFQSDVRIEVAVRGKVRWRLVVASSTHFDGEDSGRWVRGVPLGFVVCGASP